MRVVVDNDDFVWMVGKFTDTAQTKSGKVDGLVVDDTNGYFTFGKLWH